MAIFRDIERIYPPSSIQIWSNKVSFGLQNKKPVKKLLVIGTDPSILWKSM